MGRSGAASLGVSHGTGWLLWMAVDQARQKPKLGGVRISHRHYIHVHTFISVVGVHPLSLYIHVSFFLLTSCVFEKL